MMRAAAAAMAARIPFCRVRLRLIRRQDLGGAASYPSVRPLSRAAAIDYNRRVFAGLERRWPPDTCTYSGFAAPSWRAWLRLRVKPDSESLAATQTYTRR